MNRLQTIKRQRDFSIDEISSLYELIESKETHEETRIGVYLLLDQQKPAELHFAKLSDEEKKNFEEYPIYHFWKTEEESDGYYGSAQLEKVSDVLGMPALGPRKRNITPMVLAEKVKHWMTLCVKDSKLYMYNGSCYRCMEQSDMETIIWGSAGRKCSGLEIEPY